MEGNGNFGMGRKLVIGPSFKNVRSMGQSTQSSRNYQAGPVKPLAQPQSASRSKLSLIKTMEIAKFDSRVKSTLWSNLAEDMVKENEAIKKKMREYQSSIGTRKGSNMLHHTHNEQRIISKLKTQALQINLLLARKMPLESIEPLCERVARSTVQSQYNGKVNCKLQPLPLVLSVTVNEGMNSSYICFSFSSERLNRDKCDKAVLLSKHFMVIKFEELRATGVLFSHSWVYIGLETSSQCSVVLKCSFGQGKRELTVVRMRSSNVESRSASLYPFNPQIPLTKPKDIERAVRNIVEDPEKIRTCNYLARQVREKRKRNQRTNLIILARKTEPAASARYERVLLAREKIENCEATRKFVISNKQHIQWLYVILRLEV